MSVVIQLVCGHSIVVCVSVFIQLLKIIRYVSFKMEMYGSCFGVVVDGYVHSNCVGVMGSFNCCIGEIDMGVDVWVLGVCVGWR